MHYFKLNSRFLVLFLPLVIFSAVSALGADPESKNASTPEIPLKFAAVFSDHMVIQREKPVPVWGWTQVGEAVTVEFAGQTKSAKADDSGKWLVNLDPIPASAEGRELTVRSGTNHDGVKITDVLVGDVWLGSGQSNMAFQMKSVANSTREIAAADHPVIRFFRVDEQFSQQPSQDVTGQWKPVSSATVADCSAVAFYFARALHQKHGVPIGLLISSVGGTRIETWMQTKTLEKLGLAEQLIAQWKSVSAAEFDQIATTYRAYQHQRYHGHPQAVAAAKKAGTPIPPEPVQPKPRCHDCPGALHNGMIVPLQPFAIRGVIWYQGEGNAGNPGGYEKMQPALIADWREVWGAELPFLFVQLAPHNSVPPAFREAQQSIWQNTPHTAMTVTTDVGDATNIHPIRKQPVGERLALAARALSYGEQVEYSGPVFREANFENGRAVISFDHLGDGLMAKGDVLKGFTMAAADGNFINAQATIQGANVIVTSQQIQKPNAVRYAWAKVPDANLYNLNGLPAVPFRSDLPIKSDRPK